MSAQEIDRATLSALDIQIILDILLGQVTAHLEVDAASIMLLNPKSLTLTYTAGRGFHSRQIGRSSVRLGQGLAGAVALEQRALYVPDLQTKSEQLVRHFLLNEERFVSAYFVPLIAKGQVQGVLELFHRSPLQPDAEWVDFLHLLAGQAAIAIESTALFSSLQRSNLQLSLAYDATIEGWSHALDLRDKETEGHSLRVTEMAERLARSMGMKEEDVVQVRRGALLHDIGKMGVPDAILLKPGALTDEEWEIMRLHPTYGYKMLAPIAFLRPALDIPHYHHEKWNGTGYPDGLKGEEIPLAARIFAIVDVWDALRSDRPYRAGWPEEKALQHIQEQSGTHFDPQVVDAFMRLISMDRETKARGTD